jgi:glucan phosphoethanolaminetransferase (alkaline phosphatase superfamily)
MEKQKINIQFGIAVLIVLLAAFSRLIPHPANFAPIGAMALFSATVFSRRYQSFVIPIFSMWLSDLIINNVLYAQYFGRFVWFYPGFYWTYGAFFIIGILGPVMIKKVRLNNLVAASLSASVIFFLVSNFGVWFSTTMYPKNWQGLLVCYTAGLPFLRNTLMGDLFYTGILFGAFELASKKLVVAKSIEG